MLSIWDYEWNVILEMMVESEFLECWDVLFWKRSMGVCIGNYKVRISQTLHSVQ